MPVYSRLKQDYISFFLQLLLKLASKIWCQFVKNLQRYDTISAHVHVPKRALRFASEKLQYTGMAFIKGSVTRDIYRS